MSKRVPVVEWYMVEDDAKWERQYASLLPDNERAANRHWPPQGYFWSMASLLLLVSISGGWYMGQARSQQTTAELRATTQRELRAVAGSDNPFATRATDDQAILDCGRQVDRSLRTVEFLGDQAVTRVFTYTASGALAYRQTYFYRCAAEGWQRTTTPDPTLWGAERTLVTPFFVYHFRQNDALAVMAVAAQVDTLYTILRQNFGLPAGLSGEKLTINVSVTQLPGVLPWFDTSTPIRVSSPVLYVAPVDLTDAELLAQSIALLLIEQVLAQASEHYAIGESWQLLLDGLYLWQLWDLDLPLSVWHKEVVTWVYADLPTMHPGQAVVLPAHYTTLCAAHKLWLPSPTEMKIPLICSEVAWEDFLLSPWGRYGPLMQLKQLTVPLRPGEYLDEPSSLRRTPHLGETVILATLIEYAVATYGRERLPALVVGLGQYNNWETLLPAVYGVSASEFEAGWQKYLAAQYGVVNEFTR